MPEKKRRLPPTAYLERSRQTHDEINELIDEARKSPGLRSLIEVREVEIDKLSGVLDKVMEEKRKRESGLKPRRKHTAAEYQAAMDAAYEEIEGKNAKAVTLTRIRTRAAILLDPPVAPRTLKPYYPTNWRQ